MGVSNGYAPQAYSSSGQSSQAGLQNSNASGSSDTNSQSQTLGANQGANANTYLPWQGALQGQTGSTAGNFLQTGNLPGTFGAPPQVTQAYVDNFNRSVAPQLAAQYGAGSPAIGSQLSLGLEQLQSQVFQNQSNNFNNALGTAGNLAFTPVGNTTNQNQQANNTTSGTTNWQANESQVNALADAAKNTGYSWSP